MNNILELKKRIDNIINSINNGNYNNSIEILLDELELINIDRNILQNTRIGSSLTKLSKSLLPIHKITSQRVISIINKWKSQLRNSVTVTGTTASNGPEVTTDNLTTSSNNTKDSTTTGPSTVTEDNTTNNTTKNPTGASTVTMGKGANSTAMECTPGKGANSTAMECTRERELTTAMECTSTNSVTTMGKRSNSTAIECTSEKILNEIAVVTKTGESSTFSTVTMLGHTDANSTNITSSNTNTMSTVGTGVEETDAVGASTVTENPKYMGPLRNNIYRDKALRYLFDSFIIGKDFEIEMEELTEKINLIEKSLYNYYIIEKNNQKGYNQQLKCIGFNLKDNKNTIFNYKLYNNIISINELIHMSSLQMASDEKKLQRNEILEQSLEACQSDWEIKNIFLNNKTKGQFKCNKCNSKITTYYQLQTRSSDEPMTTFVTCLNCNNRWKF